MAVNLDACIQCTRCVRACREEQVNDVIGYAFRGEHAKIVFDFDDPMGDSHLRRLRRMRAGLPDRRADAGDAGRCRNGRARPTAGRLGVPVLRRRLPAHLSRQGQQDLHVDGRDGPANHDRLCVKGRFGFDYVAPSAAPDQAADPQGRRAEDRGRSGRSGQSAGRISARRPGKRRWTAPPPACKQIRDRDGPQRAGRLRLGQGLNEEAYLFQKLVRTGFGTNNVDHCTRLCHASSVAALLEGVGSAAVTEPGQRRARMPTSSS